MYVTRSIQAALEAIERWSEMHQKQQTDPSTVREDQTYLPVVIRACYEVFDYLHGWLVDSTVRRDDSFRSSR
jgi:hypothetical protein